MADILKKIFDKPILDPSGPPPKIDFKEFEKVITSRRAVRKFTDKPITKEQMNQILSMAMLAPSSSNLQPWEFYWVKNPETREAMQAIFLNQQAVKTCAELVVVVARTNTWRRNAEIMVEKLNQTDPKPPKILYDYYTKIVPLAYSIGPFGILGFFKSIFVTIAGIFKPIPRESTSRSELRIWAVKSTALACENLMLSARAMGFDSCPMEGMDSSRLKRILQLPSDAVVVMGIALGERAADGVYGPQIRFDSKFFVHEI